MPHSFVQITVHAVFATKARIPFLKPPHRPRIHAYVASVLKNNLGFSRLVGGTDDHVHMLFDLKPTVALSDCVRTVKCVSSGWIHGELDDLWDFGWQEGYGAFSVSASKIDQVVRYIQNQDQHHRARSFEDEFVALLERHGIEYDPRFLWKEPAWHDDAPRPEA